MKTDRFAAKSSTLLLALHLAIGHNALAQDDGFKNTPAPSPPSILESDNANLQTPVQQNTLPPTAALSWQNAVDFAMQNHPSIQGARQRLNASNFELDAAEYQRFPTPSVDYGRVGGGSSGNQTTISLTQPLYAFGRIDSSIAAAENRVGAASIAIEETKVDLIDRVLIAFFDVNKTRELIETQREFVRQHEDLRNTVQRRFQGDVGSQSDLLLAQTRLDQAQNQLAIFESQYNKATATLQSLTKVNALGFVMPEKQAPAVQSEPQLQALAKNFSPTIKRLTAERDALKEEAQVAGASTKPQVVLRAERVETNIPTTFTDNRIVTLLQYQPGAGLSAGSRAAAAESRTLAAELDIQAAQLQLSERCATLFNEMTINLSQERSLTKVLESNQGFFESMLRQFQAGKRSWLDVLNSVRETNQAAISLATTRNDAQLNVRRVSNLAGLGYTADPVNKEEAKND